MDAFPPELLAIVFSQLPYFSLLDVSAVCRCWRDIIFRHVFLCQQIFKIRSDDLTEVDPILPTVTTEEFSISKIQFHPVFSKISYRIGDELDAVQLATNHHGFQNLSGLAVANDFASIPPVTEIKASILPAHLYGMKNPSLAITFTISNPNGVRVLDIFSQMVIESRKKCDLLSIISLSGGMFSRRLHSNQSPALFMKAELLGDQKDFLSLQHSVTTEGIKGTMLFPGVSPTTRKESSTSVVILTATTSNTASIRLPLPLLISSSIN